MKNKKGAISPILIVLLVIIAGAVVYGVYTQSVKPGVPGGADGDCEVEPYIVASYSDSINKGTSVTESISNAVVKGTGDVLGVITTGSSGATFSVGEELTLIINGTNYDAKAVDYTITKCGENEVRGSLTKLDGSPTVTVFNDAGNQVTDSATGGLTNQSSSANPIIVDMHFTMPSDEGAEEAIFVVESSNTTETDKITMSGNKGTVTEYGKDVPDLHSDESTVTGTKPITNSFRATGFANNGGKTIYSITFEPESGITMGSGDNSVFITWYFPQAFVDVDGTVQFDIENEDGTAQHISAASSDYDFSIGNAE